MTIKAITAPMMIHHMFASPRLPKRKENFLNEGRVKFPEEILRLELSRLKLEKVRKEKKEDLIINYHRHPADSQSILELNALHREISSLNKAFADS